MTKEEKIKKAWGKLNKKVDENGWLYFGYTCNGWDDIEDWLEQNKTNSDKKYYDMTYHERDNGYLVNVHIRPKSLQGIEDNNGWIKIESEDDLFKDFITCYIMTIYSDNTVVEAYYSWGERRFKPRDKYSTWSYSFDEITHYQPIKKPKPPIY